MPKEFINDGKLSDEELEMILGKVQSRLYSYSRVQNKRACWNKHACWNIL